VDLTDDATMLQQISKVLQHLCNHNADLRTNNPTIFDSVARPTMSVHCYLVRIRRYTKFDSACFLVALAYLGRLCNQHGPSFCPTHHNIHRLFITSVLVASKANDDIFHANIFMAQCGGITNTELNKLEVELCDRLRWGLFVEPEELFALSRELADPSRAIWTHMSTVSCEQRWHGLRYAADELAAQHCDLATGRLTPPSSNAWSSRPGLQRSLSLGRVLGRMPVADCSHDASKDRSLDQTASPRSVLSRTLSFGGFLGSFSALVSLGS